MKMKKIKAFTILEMIINLALMSIIISMVYFVYSFFSETVSDYSNMSEENFETQLFYMLLKDDFYLSDKVVSLNEGDFNIVFYNEETITYIQKNEYLFRQKGLQIDSLKVTELQFEFLLNDTKEASEKLIKSITVKSLLYNKEVPLFVYKNYFSNYLIAEQ